MPAWNHWYHVTITAYGQWLPGDPRGWRVRDHKYHVPGDYKNPPPPSKFATNLHAYAKSLLKNDPVFLPQELRQPIGERILESLTIQRIDHRALAIAPKHVHVLLQSANERPKLAAGKCKQNVSRNIPCTFESGWWAQDSHAEPIGDAAHFANAIQYILDHVDEGAWVWRRS